MTVEQFHELDFGDARVELVGGAVVVHDVMPIHAYTQTRIASELDGWTRAVPGRGLALCPTVVDPTEYDSYAPDVLWIAEGHVPDDLRVILAHIPDLVVEVRSPSTWRYDRGRKREIYEAVGVGELWLVDPYDELVSVLRRSTPDTPTFDLELVLGREDTLRSPLLPDFELPLERIFFRR
jgi:Uma2 family endonuclease